MARKAIEITEEMLSECERLASLGLNEKQISESLGMAYSSFQLYKLRFRESLKNGRASLRERITGKVLEGIDNQDNTLLIFTAKRLNLFQPSMNAPKAPKTAQEAVIELSRIYKAVAEGSISETYGEKLALLIEKVAKGIEVSELEERITALEEAANESK